MSAAAHIHRPEARVAPPVTRTFAKFIAVVGTAVWATSVLFVVASVPAGQAVERGTVHALVVGVPLVAGIYALQVPRHTRFGLLLLLAGFAWSLTALAESSESVPYSIGRVAAWLIFPSLIYLALAFPV